MQVLLILVVCLMGTDECRDQPFPIEELSLPACTVQGQILAQDWLREHPKYELRGWKCRIGMPGKDT